MGINAAAFDTEVATFFSGSASKRISRALKRMGADIIAPPGRFIVTGMEGPLAEGELDRAREWARGIRDRARLGMRGIA